MQEPSCFSSPTGFNSIIVRFNKFFFSTITLFGEFSIFVFETFRLFQYFWKRRGLFLRQCESIGVSSLGITLSAGLFLGAVLGYQLYVSFHQFGAEAILGGSVGVALFRELGPVMTGVMVTGRAGASMAAEISSMKVTEQIDALEVMGIDPIEYLVMPRVLAGFFMVPLLASFFSLVASFAAAIIACGVMGLQSVIYWNQYIKFVDPIDLFHCWVKAATFGFILTGVGCFCGFRAYGGARAVGEATRNTVVAALLSILLSDYFLTSMLPFGFKKLKVM